MRRRIILVLISTAIFLSCRPAVQVITTRPQPRALVRAVNVKKFNNQHAVLELQMDLENPGPDLIIQTAQYEIMVDTRNLAVGDMAIDLPVAQNSVIPVSLPIDLAYLYLSSSIRSKLKNGEAVPIVVQGVLQARAGLTKMNLEFNGETTVNHPTE